LRCVLQSLTELQKRRHTITEPECRYFIQQVALACAYLHRAQVIHRDLKLGNLFLNDAMEIKIGDFGLATRLDYDGERKLYACFSDKLDACTELRTFPDFIRICIFHPQTSRHSFSLL